MANYREKWKFLTYGMHLEKCPIFLASARGKQIPLLKTLLSNACINNCLFCPYRNERRIQRTIWKKEELVNLTIKLTKANKIQGLFLSSGIMKDPIFTSEKQIEVAKELRKVGYNNYIHLTLMPGITIDLMKRAIELSNRVGINIEFPSQDYYDEVKLYLSFKQDVLKRLKLLSRVVEYYRKRGKKVDLVTQFIVGVREESDKEILEMTEYLYKKLNVRRVYYSAFEPIPKTPLENKKPESKEREIKLYRAGFLIRDYRFSFKDFEYDEKGNLIHNDPKKSLKPEIKEKYSFEDLKKFENIGIKKAIKLSNNYSLLKFFS
ncbi:MAG: radical SAM protein [Candidatus Aenigmatarchaeota archaeon]